MRKAVIREADGLVVNVIEITFPNQWQPPKDCYLINAGNGSPGDTWNGVKFVKPEPPILVPPRDLAAEIDELNIKVLDHETRLKKVEKV